MKYRIENIHSATYPVPKINIQGSFKEDKDDIIFITSKSFFSLGQYENNDQAEMYMSSSEINITLNNNSTITRDVFRDSEYELFCLSEKCDKIFYHNLDRFSNNVYGIYAESKCDGNFCIKILLFNFV